MAKCETECRDEIYKEFGDVRTCVGKKVDKSSMWRSLLISLAVLTFVWGIVAWALTDSTKLKAQIVEDNKKSIVENRLYVTQTREQVAQMREQVAGMKVQINNLQGSSEQLSKDVRQLLREIRTKNNVGRSND